MVSNPFELGDEAAGGAFRVAAGEVVAASLAVELPGLSMCQQPVMIECLTAQSGRPWPRAAAAAGIRRRGSRRWCGWVAAITALVRALS